MACSSKFCAGSPRAKPGNELMLLAIPNFFLTNDDHLLHNVFDSVARRRRDRHQLGMSDFLRRNPQQKQIDSRDWLFGQVLIAFGLRTFWEDVMGNVRDLNRDVRFEPCPYDHLKLLRQGPGGHAQLFH